MEINDKQKRETPNLKRTAGKKDIPRITKGKEGVANITVVGVGGGGCNTVSHLLQERPVGMNFVCMNTDAKALQTLKGEGLIVLPIGEALTRGFGAGGNPEVGERAALPIRPALKQVLSGSDIVFITSGMGGGTGTGAAPVVAQVAKEVGALTVAMVTLPFSWEGHKRMETAISGLTRLRQNVDNMIYIHNDMMTRLAPEDATVQEAFKIADATVTEGIMVVSEIANTPGDINVDLADVKAILGLPGNAVMSVGEGIGKDRAQTAADHAIKNHAMDLSIAGAQGVLFMVKGSTKLTVDEVNSIGRRISQAVSRDATIFFGMSIRPEMQHKVRVTIIATGLPDKTNEKML